MTQTAKQKAVYIVEIKKDGKVLYFQKENQEKQEGYFTHNIKQAKLFYDTLHTQNVACAYDGAEVVRL